MTENLEWDWPPTKRYRKRRRARVEVLPPKQDEQEPRPQRVEIILRSRQQSTANWPTLIVAVVAVLFLGRYSFTLFLIGVIAWKLVTAMLMMAAVVTVARWRSAITVDRSDNRLPRLLGASEDATMRANRCRLGVLRDSELPRAEIAAAAGYAANEKADSTRRAYRASGRSPGAAGCGRAA